MRNIGLMGYSRSGKDTAGRHLVQAHGYRRVSFADPVRASLLALDPLVPSSGHACKSRGETCRLSHMVACLGWERSKDEVPEVRTLLQRHGTDAVRGVIGDDTWIRVALRKISEAETDGVPVTVTDVRFPNEVDALREAGFRLVWVLRPGFEPVNGHSSETSVNAADAHTVLYNDADVDELCAQIEELAE